MILYNLQVINWLLLVTPIRLSTSGTRAWSPMSLEQTPIRLSCSIPAWRRWCWVMLYLAILVLMTKAIFRVDSGLCDVKWPSFHLTHLWSWYCSWRYVPLSSPSPPQVIFIRVQLWEAIHGPYRQSPWRLDKQHYIWSVSQSVTRIWHWAALQKRQHAILTTAWDDSLTTGCHFRMKPSENTGNAGLSMAEITRPEEMRN